MFRNESHICLCLWENRGTNKYIPGLSIKLAKISGCDFPTHATTPETVNSFLSDTEFDRPGTLHLHFVSKTNVKIMYSAGQEISSLLWNPKVYFNVHKCSHGGLHEPAESSSQLHIFFYTHSNIILLSINPKWSYFIFHFIFRPCHGSGG
jgi:hypothetical protein